MLNDFLKLKHWSPDDWFKPDAFVEVQEWVAENNKEPRFHGNGFVQLYVADDRRVHVWHPDVVATRVENARIHDHRFDLTSTVLLGKLQHISYELDWAWIEDDGQFGIYIAPGASNKEVPLEQEDMKGYNAVVREHFWMSPGTTYTFKARKFHESRADRLTMTIMDKGPADGDPARILGPYWDTPDHAFLKQPDVDVLWGALHEAFDELRWSRFNG